MKKDERKKVNEKESLGKRLKTDDTSSSVGRKLKAFPDSSINDSSKDFAEDPNSLEHHEKPNSHVRASESLTIKQRIFKLLNKYHDLKPEPICKILELPYKKYASYVSNCKTEWKSHFKNRHVLKRLKFHNWRGWIYALKSMSREEAVENGWVQTKARNKMLLWKDPKKLGRLEWHLSGRINVWCRKPVTKGKLLQLLANAVFRTGLIFEIEIFNKWTDDLKFKGEHLTYDTGEVLPYAKIDFLKNSNGVVVKTGDATHPTHIEIEFHYPLWCERNELLFDRIMDFFEKLDKPKPLKRDRDRSMVV